MYNLFSLRQPMYAKHWFNYEVVNMIHWQWMHMQPFVYNEKKKLMRKCIVDTSLRLLVHIQAIDQIWILYPKFIFVPLPVDAQMALTVHLNALYNRRMECKGFGSLRKASKKMELNIHFLIEVPLLPFPLINWEKIKLSFLFFHTNIIKGIKVKLYFFSFNFFFFFFFTNS